ncbi:MAG TPA: NTP transferase domain-containing protein, partial [Gemmatimonadaceae bacterium]|nr:NTP transferase domain-containing protein [Gemmatimonadaceae bacterium]
MSASRIAAIVLAAGASSRMGRNKLLLDVGGVPMVRRAVETVMHAGASPVVVVVGNDEQRVREALTGLHCTFATNADFTGPTSASLHAGLRMLGGDVDGV